MRRSPFRLLRRGALLPVAFLLLASPAAGETVPVPGGPESIRRLLHLDGRRIENEFFFDVTRALLAGSTTHEAWHRSERRRAVADFAEDMAEWRAELGCPAILSAGEDGWEKSRRALKWLGFKVRGKGPGFQVEPRSDSEAQRRQGFLDVLGQPTSDTIRRLSAGETVPVACNDGDAELPFGLEVWRETLGVDETELTRENAFLYFVKDVPASRMLVALQAVDARTLEEVRALGGEDGGPKGWALLYGKALDGFARFPEVLVIRDGRIRLPGGPEAEAVWADVVGEPPAERARFVVGLFTADSGKAAYVADALGQLPEPAVRAFVLGRSSGGEKAVKRFRRLYNSIERAGGNVARPQRDPYDFTHLARFLRLSDDGDIVVPGGAALWLEALSGSGFPGDEAELSALLADASKRPDATDEFLLRLFRRDVAGAGRDVPAQKRFLMVSSLVETRSVLADPGTVVLLFRGLERLLPSFAPLEDLPLDDPVVVRRFLFTLNRLDTVGGGRAAELRAGLFQASVDLLAAFCRSGSLGDARARELVRSLLDLPLFASPKTEPSAGIGAFSRWLGGGLLAALKEEETLFLEKARRSAADRDPEAAGPNGSRTPDDLVAWALAGWREPVTFPFRGGSYVYDSAHDGGVRRRLFAATQEHVPLLGLEGAVAEREKALLLAREGDAQGMRAAVDAFLEELSAARLAGRGDDERVEAVAANARVVLGELRAATKEDALSRLEGGLERLDALLAERYLESLAVHVYSTAVCDPSDLPYTDALFVRRHSLAWGGGASAVTESPFGPTRIEPPAEGKVLRLAGSFSGLADALGLLHAEGLVYGAGSLIANDQVRAGLVATVVRVTPARLDDDALLFVDLSCRAAEELAASLAERPVAERLDAWGAVARDLVPGVRRSALASAPPTGVRRHLTPSDLFQIGRRLALRNGSDEPRGPAARAAREAWQRLVSRYGAEGAGRRVAELGPRPLSWAGRNRLSDMEMPSYERLAEYRLPNLFADRLFDLKISAARAVVAAGDPAALLPLVLETALDDFLRGVRTSYAFDWRPLAQTDEAVARTSRDQLLEAALASGRITRAEEAGTW